jgi:hypothetical protein
LLAREPFLAPAVTSVTGCIFLAARRPRQPSGRAWSADLCTRPHYRRRASYTEQVGIPTLGFSTAVQALHQYGDQPVRLGAVDVDDPPYHFQLFLDNELTSVIACLGVDQDPAHRRIASE